MEQHNIKIIHSATVSAEKFKYLGFIYVPRACPFTKTRGLSDEPEVANWLILAGVVPMSVYFPTNAAQRLEQEKNGG